MGKQESRKAGKQESRKVGKGKEERGNGKGKGERGKGKGNEDAGNEIKKVEYRKRNTEKVKERNAKSKRQDSKIMEGYQT